MCTFSFFFFKIKVIWLNGPVEERRSLPNKFFVYLNCKKMMT